MDTNARMELFNTYLDYTGLDHKDYQQDGVKWCLNNELRENPPHNVRGGFIADEMGLGKTILMIGTMGANLVTSTLIVLPPVLLDQWYLQILRTTGHKAFIYHGPSKKTTTLEQLKQKLIVLTTYGAITLTRAQLLGDERTPLHQVSWSRIIFDEAHHLRNKKTALHMSALLLRAPIKWLVTGTPVQNKKQDFHNLCAVIGLPAADKSNLAAREFILKRTKIRLAYNCLSYTSIVMSSSGLTRRKRTFPKKYTLSWHLAVCPAPRVAASATSSAQIMKRDAYWRCYLRLNSRALCPSSWALLSTNL